MKSKNIHIFTVSLGQGHNTAAQGLFDRFKKEGHNVSICNLTKVSIASRIIKIIFSWVTEYPLLWKFIFKASNTTSRNFISRWYTKWAFSSFLEKYFSQHNNIDEVWLTNPLFSAEIDMFFSGKKYIQVTDYGVPHAFWTWGNSTKIYCPEISGKIFVEKHFPEKRVDIQKFLLPQKIQEISEFSHQKILEIKKTLGLSHAQKITLFFFHGFLFGNEEEVLRMERKKNPDTFFCILAGKNTKKFQKFSQENFVRVYGWIDDISLFYAVSEKVIGKAGGAFVSEILFLEKDYILYNALPGQEENNKKFLENLRRV